MKEYPLSYATYKEALAQGRVMGLHCRDCGSWTTPPQPVCSSCGGRALDPGELKPQGTIRSFTVIRTGPVGFEPPYVVALAELAEGPWVLGLLEGVDPDQAGFDLIGKPVGVSGKTRPAEVDYTDRERAVVVFKLA